jgi:D-alanyl-lipoteichoic acid acyltransferase DltB (MBOAT superfamily)
MQVLHTIVFFGLLVMMPAGWLLPARWQLNALSLLTAAFLLLMAPVSATVLLLTAGLSYALFQLPGLRPGAAVLLAIGQAVAVWMVFKSEWATHAGWWTQVGVPLGLSYYTFRQIHYAIERYKQTLPAHNWADYLRYLFFLPTMLVGPLNRFPDFFRDARRRRWDTALFSAGLERILYGYVKIVVLGNALLTNKLGHLIERLMPVHPALATYLGIIKFAANAYVQFAGYSDIAIGLSLTMGFRIMENFHAPFLAPNLSEFWKRYHISLSSWCRDYVFTPLLSLTRRGIVAIAASMLVLGLWHEWSWRYLIWGALQGAGILAWHRYHRWQERQPVLARPSAFAHWSGVVLTLHFYCFSCVIIRENSWQAVLTTFHRLVS